MIYVIPILAVLVAMTLAVLRAIVGPTVFDRLLAANAIGNSAIVLLALFGFFAGRPEFLDLGLVYALLNIIATFAVLKIFSSWRIGTCWRRMMFSHLSPVEFMLLAISFSLLLAGSFFYLVGALGIVRMPDVYTRMHAASVSETLGIGLILLGLMIQAGLTLVTVKLVFLLLLIWFAGPFATHALAQTALHDGVKPLRRGRGGTFVEGPTEPDDVLDAIGRKGHNA